ncbi:hypothetical protein PJ267_06915 [Arthrobacter sp. OVS8]|nr:hypothetical protein PJ267_06915 [Arthrobacter sp. OVS8]
MRRRGECSRDTDGVRAGIVGIAGGRLRRLVERHTRERRHRGPPQETVAVSTRTHTVVDAFSRRINDAGRPTQITDVPYTVVPDPAWRLTPWSSSTRRQIR